MWEKYLCSGSWVETSRWTFRVIIARCTNSHLHTNVIEVRSDLPCWTYLSCLGGLGGQLPPTVELRCPPPPHEKNWKSFLISYMMSRIYLKLIFWNYSQEAPMFATHKTCRLPHAPCKKNLATPLQCSAHSCDSQASHLHKSLNIPTKPCQSPLNMSLM